MNTVIYPGSFDPITFGHLDLIKRALNMFDKVIVAVADNRNKQPTFDLQQRLELVRRTTEDLPGVQVCGFQGLLMDFAKGQQTHIILRGLRATADFEYEFQMAGINRLLDERIETIFLTPSQQCSYVSSTMVREIAALGGDVSAFVPPVVRDALSQLTQENA